MPTLNMLYRKEIPINDKIKIVVPTVRDIINDEDGYYGMVAMLTSMPIDMMVQLDDIGIDFSKISEYELFLLLFFGVAQQDAHLVFGDLDLTKFQMAINEQNGMQVLVDREHDIVIDRSIQGQIADALRKINHFEKNIKKPGNDEARKYMIERARVKQKRNSKRKQDSQLEQLIIALVNTEQYKYDYEGTLELSIYQFNESVRQIMKKIDYDNKMHGIYAGTVSAKDLNKDDLNWLIHN